MSKRVLVVLASLLSIAILTSCTASAPPAGAQVSVGLTTPLQRNMVKNAEFRVDVVVVDRDGKPVQRQKVTAEVLDDDNAVVGKFTCRQVPGIAGRYQSETFTPPEKAKPGKWTANATVGQGQNAVLGSYTTHVADALGGQFAAKYDYYLDTPATWDITYQQSTQDGESVRLNPLPGNKQERALMEIRYVHGEVEVSEEAARRFLQDYRPAGYEKGSGLVTSVVETQVQGHKAWLARGTYVTDLGQDEKGTPMPDYNFSVQVLRFYCDAPKAERTFTIIEASTSDAAMSEMSAKLDGFLCHGLPSK
jgi:hypothetical protein